MKRNIFITAIGGDIGQSVLKCLQENFPKSSLYGSDLDNFAASRDEVKKFYVSPFPEDTAYADFISKVIKENDIDYLLPISEKEIIWFTKNRDMLTGTNTKIVANRDSIVETFADKFIAAQFFESNGVKHPRTFLAQDYTGELDYPFILKKRSGCGGKGMLRVEGGPSCDISDNKFKDYVVQEYVPDDCPEYTVAVFSDGKKTEHIAFKRRLGYGSLTKVAELVEVDALREISLKLAKSIGLKGSINLQFRKTGEEYVLLEINPRFSSTVYLRNYFGFKDVKWWIDLLEGKSFSYVPQYGSGVAVRRVAEIFFDMKPYSEGK